MANIRANTQRPATDITSISRELDLHQPMILFQSGLAYECTVSKLSSLSLKSRKIKVPCVPSNDGVGDSAFCTFDNGIQFSLARTTSLPTSTINYINSVHNQCCKSGVRKEIFWSVR